MGLKLMVVHHHHHRSWMSHQLRGWSEGDQAQMGQHQLGSDGMNGLCLQVATRLRGHHREHCARKWPQQVLQGVVEALKCSLVAREEGSQSEQQATVRLTRGLDQL